MGSVKWPERDKFDARAPTARQKHRARLTDEPVPLLAVSRSGVFCRGLDVALSLLELLSAWRRDPSTH
ncbi:hypothetical protein [Allorhizocola rhizosphaerae]|uniref:hypothetical protein n=1 Tax=Allorhizocola rhizosphaerae TaxID=1872709 RepID=UPI000E3E3B70|nr:hypothetical protein [Allorhizocola rhizosphaerae]